MKKFISYCSLLTICTLIAISCKNNEFTEKDRESLAQLIEENEKVHSFLMKTESGLPSLQGILDSLMKLTNSPNSDLSTLAEKMILNLKEIQGKDKEADFKQFSLFSENLAILVKDFSLHHAHKFYCPMEDKYWVAKGKRIENPYSPEMRDCGSLVETN